MKKLVRAKQPFRFYTRLHLRQLTGEKAHNLRELLAIIKKVGGASIYHHTHHFLQQHQYLSPEPPNDFAYWVREVLNEDMLAEQLSSIDVREFSSIRGLRRKIVSVIEKFLKKTNRPDTIAPQGEEFYFIRSISFVLPADYTVWDMKEFADAMERVTIDALYFHMFEARLRLEREDNDFSFWIGDNLGEEDLAEEISNLDPYSYTMEGLRGRILYLIRQRIK